MGRLAKANYMLFPVGYSPGHQFMVVAWARDEPEGKVGIDGAIELHRELTRGNGSDHQISQYQKQG